MNLLIISTIVTLAITIVVGNVLKKRSFLIDIKLKEYFLNCDLRFLKSSMKHITAMGDVVNSLVLIFPMFFYSVVEGKYVMATAILNASLFNILFLNSFKFLFRRERPVKESEIKHWGYSFPSGHSCIGLSFYPTAMHIMFQGHQSYWFWMFLGISFGLSIAVSRIVVGVHWFSDVLFGSIIGILFFSWAVYLYNIGFYYKFLF